MCLGVFVFKVVDTLDEVDTFAPVTDVIAVSRWEEVSFTSR